MRKTLAAVGAMILLHIGGQAAAQDTTVGDLTAKGAAVLSAEELKVLLSGATVRYETRDLETQMKLETDGILAGSTRKRFGSAGGTSLTGKWRVTDQGLWCNVVRATVTGGGDAEYCRSVFKVGNSYYYAWGAATDATRPAYVLKVSK